MRKLLFSALCASALLFQSCSKEDQSSFADEKLYPVTFNVSAFSAEITPMGGVKGKSMSASADKGMATMNTSSEGLHNSINYLYYYVFNESGIIVNEKSFYSMEILDGEEGDKPDPNFGKINDSLPKGNYKIVILGSKNGEGYLSSNNYTNTYTSMSEYGGGDDVFIKQLDITVDDSPLSHSLLLERLVGKIEINLLDKIPMNIGKITYAVNNVGHYYYLARNNSYNGNIISKSNHYSVSYPKGDPRRDQELSLYFFLVNQTDIVTSVNILVYNTAGDLIIDKTINNVPVGINKKTVLSGKLFENETGGAGQGFSVTVNDVFSSENHVDF